MQTNFSLAQLADPAYERSNEVLRSCVHCGFCTATCPTYVLLGDERDSPRGRIYLIRDMLERGGAPEPQVVTHIDRCLSCLSCMTTCPASVHYMHLVDHARAYIEEHHRRPLTDRALRRLLAWLLPHPKRFRLALIGAMAGRPFARMMPGRLKAMLALAPASLPMPSGVDRPQVHRAAGERRKRVALLAGCAQQVLNPAINEATIRLLTRLGCEVVVAKGAGCCGALTHHMGMEDAALASVKANVAAWNREAEGEGLDAIVINASGCGTTVKDYGFMLRNDAEWAGRAARVSERAVDVTELLAELGLPDGAAAPADVAVTYHSACSLRHGQQIADPPKDLLRAAGFRVAEPMEPHLCCGSAGTYNLMQPVLAEKLKARKADHIRRTAPDVVAAGNIGCMTQLQGAVGVPVVHTVELLDWATGGPKPAAMG
ncbi:glycolate oxidase subunit GlcF [Minwuia thermotolerans]|uniref:Glycolate oxidase iron-sulfur subunit n=1 Tax=Minwuia thermotolerans TaxID=2056226 RepID=A0A2M9FZL5_9PROT|nr:glycolate oxidase subunit GlcF [Minwuia thermotolerans]PJK28917.1 glycolate oxidase iron-sulfur subunit [Minwuia thermotolerans]